MLEIFGIILTAIFFVSSILLILLVLIQDEQGEGMGGIFGGSSSSPFGGRAGNALTRLTGILSVIFIVSTLGLAWVNKSGSTVEPNAEQQDLYPGLLEAPVDSAEDIEN